MTLTARDKSVAIALLGMIGLTSVVIWADLLGHWFGFAASSSGVQSLSNARIFFLGGYTLAALVTVFVKRLSKRGTLSVEIGVLGVACLGTLLYGFAYLQNFVPPEFPAIAGLALCGVGYFATTLFLYCELAKLKRLSVALWSIASSLFLKTVLGDAMGYLTSDVVQIISATALPCLSFACLAVMRTMEDPSILKMYRARSTISKADEHSLLYLLIAVSVVLAALRGLGHLGLWGTGYLGSPVTSIAAYVFVGLSLAAFTYGAVIRNSNDRMLIRFQPAFLIIIGGFLAYALKNGLFGPDAVAPFFSWLLLAIELFGHLLSWAVVFTAIRTTTSPIWRFQGISDSSYGIVAIACALFLQSSIANEQVLIVIAILFSMVAAVRPFSKKPIEAEIPLSGTITLASPISHVGDRGDFPEEPAHDGMSVAERLEQYHRMLAADHHLSPREIDVFLLLVQGRSRPYISNELFLSDGTVKTHVSHIYKKFGIHTREELLTAVQQAVTEWEKTTKSPPKRAFQEDLPA